MSRLAYRLADWEARHERCLQRLRKGAAIFLTVTGILGLLWH